jgi:hypothetical protein
MLLKERHDLVHMISIREELGCFNFACGEKFFDTWIGSNLQAEGLYPVKKPNERFDPHLQ